jgi:gluconate 5-dehydrogenase
MVAMVSAANVFDLSGRVVLLTGATRGLGFEMARLLASAGAHVVINGRDAARAKDAAARVSAEGGSASASIFDVTDLDHAAACIGGVAAEHGRLDGFVNNVGVRNRKGLLELSLSEIRAQIEANLIGAMWLTRAAAQAMIARKYGRIINVTSIAARMAIVPDAAYIVSKAGLESLTHALACELGPHGITVNAISPGFFATETNLDSVNDPDIGPSRAARTALRRWGQPHEIGGAAVFLCSDAASYVTGHTIVVDGGTTVTCF